MTAAELRIDLNTFRDNLARIRTTVAPAAPMVVVKDDAYAHGLETIVRAAIAAGVDWIGALDVASGSRVRGMAGDGVRIFTWLIAGADDAADGIAADLDLGIGAEDLLDDVITAARASGRTARVHLKIDSGLHRNGVRPEDWRRFVTTAAAAERAGLLRVVGIWTHIAEASDADDDEQRRLYEEAVETARSVDLKPEVLHLAASAAAFARADFRYDLVRIGAFAYGIRSTDGPSDEELGIHPIATLTAPVLRIAPVGVIVGVGSVDGLLSSAAGQLTVHTPGGPRELIEVRPETAVIAPWDGAEAGQTIEIFGGRADSATDLAERIGTIGEEIVLRISPEVPRVITD